MSEPLFRTQELSVKFGGLAALVGLDLEIQPRRNYWFDRTQWRRQDHCVQCYNRIRQTFGRQSHLSGTRRNRLACDQNRSQWDSQDIPEHKTVY